MAALDPVPSALVPTDVEGTMVVVTATVDDDAAGAEVGAGAVGAGADVVGPDVVAGTVGAGADGTVAAVVVGACGLSTSITCTS